MRTPFSLRRVGKILLPTALCAALLLGCHTDTLPNYPPAYRAYAYVTDGKSNEVSVIDLLDFHEIRDIPVGVSPTGIAANPNKNEIYVVNTDSGALSVIDAERNAVSAVIPLRKKPFFVDLTADGKMAVVANSGSNNISVIDLEQRKEVAIIPVGKAPGLARLSPDGKIAIVSNRGDGSVSVIDVAARKVRSTIPVCADPEDVAIVPVANEAFVSCSSSNQVAVIALAAVNPPNGESSAVTTPKTPAPPKNSRTRTNAPERRAAAKEKPLPAQNASPDKLLALLDVGKSPVQIAVKPDGGEIFVSNIGSDSVSEVRTDTNEVSSTHQLGSRPSRSLVTPDNGFLYVSNFGSNSVTMYDISLGQLDQVVSVGEKPDALAFTPDDNFLLVVDSGSADVAIIRRTSITNQLVTIVPVGVDPRQIAVKNFMLRKAPE